MQPQPDTEGTHLGQQTIVPVDVVGVETQLALLCVLLDGIAGLILQYDMNIGVNKRLEKGNFIYNSRWCTYRGHLHLCFALLGNLAHVVQEAATRVQGHLVPGGDGLGCRNMPCGESAG